MSSLSKDDASDGATDLILLPTPPASVTPTQPMSSRSPSPHGLEDIESFPLPESSPHTQKKKKKRKSKKSKAKEGVDVEEGKSELKIQEAEKPQVLCISRNKHWRYISSYHVSPSFVR